MGFTGSTGSGKSTLLDLVMGLITPSERRNLIDGQPVEPEHTRAWQAHLTHVPQPIFLAEVSTAENVAFGLSWADIDQERGVRLSVGQRRRLGIARALNKRADVITFDQNASTLDHDTEAAVMQAVESLVSNLTILMIAHRLSTLRNCDHVVELRDGTIHRLGPTALLLAPTSLPRPLVVPPHRASATSPH